MKILERLRLQSQVSPPPVYGGTDPKLTQELKETKQQLESILRKWKFGDQPIKNSEEFTKKFGGWIDTQLQNQKELSEFLKEYSAPNLEKLKETWTNTEKDYQRQIEELRKKETFTYDEDNSDDEVPFPSRQKLQHELKQAQEEIKRLREGREDSEELSALETERDELVRDKTTLEQEVLALNNRVKLKNTEVSRKDEEIRRLKKEKGEKEISLNKTITELKKKYSERTKQLDEEQMDNNNLTEKIERLEEEIKKLLKEKHGDGYADL
jgi:chromosome segregation ATPase